MKNVLVYDLGGSSLRVAIVTESREVLDIVQLPMCIENSAAGVYDVDPEIWWAGFCEACSQLLRRGADFGAIAAIAGCGFTRTQIAMNAQGEAVHPAITFQDARAAAVLETYVAAPELAQHIAKLNPFHPVARLIWLQQTKPALWAQVEAFLEPKDFINFKLTGIYASDRISQNAAQLFFDALAADAPSALALGMDKSLLPPLLSPFDRVGTVAHHPDSPLLGLQGIPVLCGSNDTWSCVLGSGGLRHGAAYNISGTSDVFGVITDRPYHREGLMTVQWGADYWQLGGPSQGAASRLSWAVARFMPDLTIKDAIEKSHAKHGRTPIFIPFLEGERTPYWDPDLRGAFLGLDPDTSPQDFVWAVAEGINFLSRVILERAEEETAVPCTHICFSGGLSNNPILCQLKADILGRPVFVADVPESGLIGAASVAFSTSDDITGITTGLLAKGRWYHPDPETSAAYSERFSIFEAASAAITPISHRISMLSNA
ncbi:carbohydrate kinase [Pseudorhodobacter turbinis]|uniref:Carbohydrate kinase n=1 Tax=Pseudorhodobacter turbinis TaxID=2500533 RepID=A0A4P8ECY4_9RHOB|nr:FGGY-family carbohydrate kinase [Pseudorhodobacter turbinis]QCO54587.1 carbohydrate kinase [Pseudorhodobacter turbinis]